MGLPWVRMDTNLPQHDKILALISDPSPKKWQAIACYHFGIEWSAGTGSDGNVPQYALSAIHCTAPVARLLVKYGLWDEAPNGWNIRNYADRQQLSGETYTVRKSQKDGGSKGNCIRWHGPDCGCWKASA